MYKIGLLGASGIAPTSMIEPARRRDDCVIAAVASARPGAARDFAHLHDIEAWDERYEDLIARADIDIVYVGLPAAAHARWTIAALDAGKHVICEKPFALNAVEAQEMVAAARRNGLRLMEGFHYRYHPVFEHVLGLCHGGKLGNILRVFAGLDVPIPFDPRSIRHDPSQGGGALMDLGCYPVHWVRTIMGQEPTVIEAGATRTPLGVDESMRAVLAFPDGAQAEVCTSMAADLSTRGLLRIEGTEGTVEVTNPAGPHNGHSIREWIGGAYKMHTLAGLTTFDYQLDTFLSAIKTGSALPTEGNDCVANMALIDAIYRAAA